MAYYTKCRWCQALLEDNKNTKLYNCLTNNPNIKGFCNLGCLNAWCDREDRRKKERKIKKRY